MARATAFSTTFFNEAGGYVISDVSESIEGSGFRLFLRELERARGGVDLGLPQPVSGQQLFKLFSQLREPPIVDGVKHIDTSGLMPTIDYIESNGGFRDFWVIGDREGGGLRGTVHDDVILGGNRSDFILGFRGDDFVNGGGGNDVIGGGNGDDHLFGGNGNDLLNGKRGDDILQGGQGNDTLVGSAGADTFYFSDADFDRGNRTTDIIRDFRARQGDQIVDTTGLLRVVDVAEDSPFANATVLKNSVTGDRVIVYGSALTQDDILLEYHEPGTILEGAHSMPRKGIYVGGVPSAPNGTVGFQVERAGGYVDGDNFVETYNLIVTNNTDKTILNAADLDLRLTSGFQPLNVIADSVFGASYHNGVFDLSGGGDRAIGAGQHLQMVQFSVLNRPPFVNVGIDPNSANNFIPDYPGKDDAIYQPAFKITVRLSETDREGGTAEIFIKNIGNTTLHDLDNMEFRFNDGQISVTDDPWGADFYNNRFAVEPWGTDAPHGALAVGETVKLFGFTYEVDPHSDATVQVNDFRFVSDFADLIS